MGSVVHFDIKINDKVGRYAVAKKDLKPGEIIFAELPFAYGPKADCPTLCLACYKYLDTTQGTGVFCSKCHWPVCNSDCEEKEIHKDNECQVFAASKVIYQQMEDATAACLQYECITPLRVLLAKEKYPSRWDEEIAPMSHHNDIRKDLAIWNFNQVNIVDYLRGPCKLADRFGEDLIHTVCGILEVNAFEAHSPGGTEIRCLYPKLAILSHNCVSNIAHSIATMNEDGTETGDYRVSVRATVPIKQNSELFSSYTYSLWPTMTRRMFLKESKYFECTCARCSDPRELGTHMSTLKCSKCDNGVILSTNSLDDGAIWKCTHCEFNTRGVAVQQVFRAIQADIDGADNMQVDDPSAVIEVREAMYRKYRSVLHPRNAFHTMLRVALAQMYGKVEGYALGDLPDVLLERKIELCRAVLDNLDVIEPGYTRLRGQMLYELHAPLMLLTRNLAGVGVITTSEVRVKLQEVIKMLKEAVEILCLEPAYSAEGALGLLAKQSLDQLEQNIDELVNAFA